MVDGGDILPSLWRRGAGCPVGGVFKNAAIEDPEGALAFLKQKGKEAEAGRHALATLESSVFSDLEAGLRLVAMLPEEAIRGSLPEYDRCYRSLVWGETTRRGSYWVDWLKEQPAGLNRDLMLHHRRPNFSSRGSPPLPQAFKR